MNKVIAHRKKYRIFYIKKIHSINILSNENDIKRFTSNVKTGKWCELFENKVTEEKKFEWKLICYKHQQSYIQGATEQV